jgi:hypothetical protein
MDGSVRPYGRRESILKLLMEHGPLSSRGLHALLLPQIGRKKLLVVLQRLGKHKYINKKLDKRFGGAGVYYEINRNPKVLKCLRLKGLLQENPLRPPTVSSPNMMHSERCAIWTEYFKLNFPEAEVVRDLHLDGNKVANRKLLSKRNDYELRPDVMVLLPGAEASGTRAVAIELERTMKSAKRVALKLRKYSNESLLDGVIYVCEEDVKPDCIEQIYRTRVLANVLRVKQYGERFLLFSDPIDSPSVNEPKARTTRGQAISIHNWIRTLQNTRREGRRNSTFKLGVPAAPKSKCT